MEITAVEWLVKQINDGQFITDKLIEQAKKMEKQQIIDAATCGTLHQSGEQYYNQQFKNK